MVEKIENRFPEFIMKFLNSLQLFVVVFDRPIDGLFSKLEGSSSVLRCSRFERIQQAVQTVSKSDWVIGIDVMILRI